jgi:NADPH-dependent curcumin reductase CurA
MSTNRDDLSAPAPGRNRQWRVARYPRPDEPISATLFDWTDERVPEPADGEFLVRTLCLAPVPAQRGYLEPSHNEFLENLPLGAVMRGRGVGEIIASRHPDYRAGEIFVGSLGWQDYSVQQPRGARFVFSTKKVSTPVRPLSMQLGILGQAGATAYFGLLHVGALKRGETVLVSAAAGGVGSVAGQIARIHGAGKVVGTAGSAEKCRWLVEELGFDAAINYRTENLRERLAALFPDGIDVFFDNVGGDVLNEGLGRLAQRARVVVCGFIATDYGPGPHHGPINYQHIVYRRARMEGFVVFDYWDRYAEAEEALTRWYRQGELRDCEDAAYGLENMPDALASLFRGDNHGIKTCRVAPDP